MRKLTRAELENKVKELEKELSATRIIASALLAGEKPCETETLPLEDVTEEWSCYRPYTAPGGAILITQRIKGERVIAWRVELGMDLGKYCNANNWQRETIARKFARLQATEERPSEVPAFGYC